MSLGSTLAVERRAVPFDIPAREPRKRKISLSPREWDVARLVSSGCSNAEIAKALVIRLGSVKVFMWRIYEKLGCRNRVELLRWLQSQEREALHEGFELVANGEVRMSAFE